MTNNADAQIAREWAEKISARGKITFDVDDETLAAARHILATTTPPTMADVEWDDDVHAGLCAEHTDTGVVDDIEIEAIGDFVHLEWPDETDDMRGATTRSLNLNRRMILALLAAVDHAEGVGRADA